MTNRHPNATVNGGSAGLAVAVVWLVGNVFHLDLSAEAGAAIAGAVGTVALLIGRHGLRGLWRIIVNGNQALHR